MGIVLEFSEHYSCSSLTENPKIAGSGRIPFVPRDFSKTKKCSAGTRPLDRQLLTAESPTPQREATLAVPPRVSIRSSTDPSIATLYSRNVELSSFHDTEIATNREVCLNLSMISEINYRLAVGERLKRLRIAMGKSQAELGERINVGGTAVSNYEKGERAVDPYAAFQLKLLYGAPLEWLYAGDESVLPNALAEKLKATKNDIRRQKTTPSPNKYLTRRKAV